MPHVVTQLVRLSVIATPGSAGMELLARVSKKHLHALHLTHTTQIHKIHLQLLTKNVKTKSRI